MHIRNTAATLLLAGLVTACSGSQPEATNDASSQPEVVPSTEETVAETQNESEPSITPPEPEVETATVEQYASVIAEERSGLEEYIIYVDECSVGGWDDDSLQCPFTPLTLSAKASTLSIRFSEEANEDIRLAPPPAEIADLVERTRETALDVEVAADTVNECTDYIGCEAEWFQLQMAASDLQGILDAWEPYI